MVILNLFILWFTHSAGKLKKRICITNPEYGNLQAMLDAAKVADIFLFLVGESGMDRYGKHCLASVIGQGVPAHMFVSQVKMEVLFYFFYFS